jgi:hypothetical protein
MHQLDLSTAQAADRGPTLLELVILLAATLTINY